MFQKILNILFWVIPSIFFGLNILVIISLTSIPGDATYKVKLGFEKTLLTLYKLLDKEVNLQIEFTKNRFNEVQRVYSSKNESEGLINLTLQIEEAKKSIITEKNPEVKKAAAEKYTSLLQAYAVQLDEDQKNRSVQNTNSNPSPTQSQINALQPTSIPSPSPIPTSQNLNPTITPSPSLPTITPQPTPTIIIPSNTPIPSPTTPVSTPTSFQPPTAVPTPTPTPVVTTSNPGTVDHTQQVIQQTIIELNQLRQNIPNVPQNIPNARDNVIRNEIKEEKEEKIRQDKEEREKKEEDKKEKEK